MLKSENPRSTWSAFKIYFDGTGTVTKIEGLETIPESQPGLPASKEAILTAHHYNRFSNKRNPSSEILEGFCLLS